jgi:hypothetical protein
MSHFPFGLHSVALARAFKTISAIKVPCFPGEPKLATYGFAGLLALDRAAREGRDKRCREHKWHR